MITSDLVNKIKGAIEKLRLAKDNNVKYFNFYKAINKSLIESNITNFDKDNYPALLHSLTELLRIKLTEDYTFTEHDITYNNGKFTIFVLQKIAEIIAKSQNQVEFIPQKYYKTLTELVYTLNNIEYFGYKNKMPPMVLAVYHGNIKIFESLFRIINALKNSNELFPNDKFNEKTKKLSLEFLKIFLIRDGQGNTLFLNAVIEGRFELVKFLIEQKDILNKLVEINAKPNQDIFITDKNIDDDEDDFQKSPKENSVLHYAAAQQDGQIFNLIVSKLNDEQTKALFFQKNSRNETPFHIAIKIRNFSVIEAYNRYDNDFVLVSKLFDAPKIMQEPLLSEENHEFRIQLTNDKDPTRYGKKFLLDNALDWFDDSLPFDPVIEVFFSKYWYLLELPEIPGNLNGLKSKINWRLNTILETSNSKFFSIIYEICKLATQNNLTFTKNISNKKFDFISSNNNEIKRKELLLQAAYDDYISNHTNLCSREESRFKLSALVSSLCNFGYSVANRNSLLDVDNRESGMPISSAYIGGYTRSEFYHPKNFILEAIQVSLGNLIYNELTESLKIEFENQNFKENTFFKLLLINCKDKKPNKNTYLDYLNDNLDNFKPALNQLFSSIEPFTFNCDLNFIKSSLENYQSVNKEDKNYKSFSHLLHLIKCYYFVAIHCDKHFGTNYLKDFRKTGIIFTHEEVVEKIFLKLNEYDLQFVIKNTLGSALEFTKHSNNMISSTITVNNIPNIDSKIPMLNKFAEDLSRNSNSSMLNRANANENRKNYDVLLERRTAFLSLFKNTPSKESLCKMMITDAGYPCIIFDLHNVFNALGIKPSDNGYVSEKENIIVKVLQSLFVANVNIYSVVHYGDNYIWSQIQASFGSLRSSFSSTGISFRFSPGLLPDSFAPVLKATFERFNNILSTIVDKENNLFNDFISILLKQDGNNKSVYININDDELMHLAFESFLENEDNSNFISNYLKKIDGISPGNKLDSKTINDHQCEKINKLKSNIANIIKQRKRLDDKFANAAPPHELIHNLFNKLEEYANNSLNNFQLSLNSESHLAKQIEIELNQILAQSNDAKNNYNQAVTCIEVLTRLMHIYCISTGTLSNSYFHDEFDQKSFSAESHITNRVIKNKGNRDINLTTFPTSGGMAALTTILNAFAASEEPFEILKDTVYFEIGTNYYTTLKDFLSKGTLDIGEKGKKIDLNQKNKNNKKKIKIIDPKPFPNDYRSNYICEWSTKKWSEINKKDIPDILLVDLTCCSIDTLLHLQNEFSNFDDGPSLLITFSSENKFGQMSVDTISMGEIRVYDKIKIKEAVISTLKEELDNTKLSIALCESLVIFSELYQKENAEDDSKHFKSGLKHNNSRLNSWEDKIKKCLSYIELVSKLKENIVDYTHKIGSSFSAQMFRSLVKKLGNRRSILEQNNESIEVISTSYQRYLSNCYTESTMDNNNDDHCVNESLDGEVDGSSYTSNNPKIPLNTI